MKWWGAKPCHLSKWMVVERIEMTMAMIGGRYVIEGNYYRTVDDESIEIEVIREEGGRQVTHIVKVYNHEIIDETDEVA